MVISKLAQELAFGAFFALFLLNIFCRVGAREGAALELD